MGAENTKHEMDLHHGPVVGPSILTWDVDLCIMPPPVSSSLWARENSQTDTPAALCLSRRNYEEFPITHVTSSGLSQWARGWRGFPEISTMAETGR